MIFVLIIGALTGYAAFRQKGSSFGMWWNLYLGIAGATFATIATVYLYYTHSYIKQFSIGFNFYSIAIDIIGSLLFLSAARFYHKTNFFKQPKFR
jgi:uncharacterized membrane protein YeaQ/YmgE (transglycosylase-associated protein family)